ncbi:MAG: hypothetical protein GY756_28065 [bacterium]|nr:hypothetical protein [bacterium]
MILFNFAASNQTKNKAKPNRRIAYLDVDGKEHKIFIAEKVQLNIGDKNYSVQIRLDSYRIFSKSDSVGKYYANMAYNFDDSDPNV